MEMRGLAGVVCLLWMVCSVGAVQTQFQLEEVLELGKCGCNPCPCKSHASGSKPIKIPPPPEYKPDLNFKPLPANTKIPKVPCSCSGKPKCMCKALDLAEATLNRAVARQRGMVKGMAKTIYKKKLELKQQKNWLRKADGTAKILTKQISHARKTEKRIAKEIKSLKERYKKQREDTKHAQLKRDLAVSNINLDKLMAKQTDLQSLKDKVANTVQDVGKRIEKIHAKAAEGVDGMKAAISALPDIIQKHKK